MAISSIPFRSVAVQVWLGTFTFSAVLALPALVFTPGVPLYQVSVLSITGTGIHSALYLILRTETAATLGTVLVFTTPWAHVLKALRMFRVPSFLVAILGMTCRYILLLLQTAREMFESRRCRTVGTLTRSEHRTMAIHCAGALLSRSMQLSGDVFLAMQSRGYRGEVHLIDDFQMKTRDWISAAAFAVLTVSFVWMSR